MVREIQIENFKSISSLSMDLGRFNVLIGANGCGKSNVLEAITFGTAALTVKLTNEFLSTRGIRVTEPELMQSAFSLQNQKKGINLYFSDDKKNFFRYRIYTKNGNWYVKLFIDNDAINLFNKSNYIKNPSPFGYNCFIYDEITYPAKDGSPETIMKINGNMRDIIAMDSEKFIHSNKLSDFLIYAPENYFLRNNFDENQIKPLGVRGEGLFKHLAAIGFKKL